MKEKLIEEWLIRTKERGSLDQAFAQWLIHKGYKILWFGHSRTEFGKDITALTPEGDIHCYQIKDENLDLDEYRKIFPQISELIEIPPIHPNIPAGASHKPFLATSGLANEVVQQRVRAENEGRRARGFEALTILDRRELIVNLVEMSDAFWPQTPIDVKDYFTFYFSEGRGDFNKGKFANIVERLLTAPTTRAQIEVAVPSIAILGHCLLASFDARERSLELFSRLGHNVRLYRLVRRRP